jgi:hypothetical protein
MPSTYPARTLLRLTEIIKATDDSYPDENWFDAGVGESSAAVLPREAREANKINGLRNRLGKYGFIILQGFSRLPPKPTSGLARVSGAVQFPRLTSNACVPNPVIAPPSAEKSRVLASHYLGYFRSFLT